ncbi:hypothetical protein BGZ80_003804 [Entomortierella chlamydospora]|uniref:CLASP N-terminal domain-containing protein n=1 Tax=Entomortierella chlamydospora TaxID=101097 RepID=A0A9P6SW98_9FUNG|nr:hypothetical protein BGZ80_003804 [Entomortierella chlamydospora]
MVTRAVKALSSIINAGCVVTLPKVCQAFASNNKTLRIACIGLIASCIALFTSQELEPFLAAFEPVLKEGVSDAAPEVRDTSRKSFKVYAEKFPERSQMTNTSAVRRPDTGDLARQQSTVGLTRTGPSRVGPVRARTIATAEQSSTFKTPALSSQSTQPYSYHGAQQSHTQQPSVPHQTLTRNHGPASRTGTLGDLSDNGNHGVLRVSSQRSRTFSSSATNSMPQRSPSINLATNGGPQRVVPSGSYGAESTKPARPTSMINRLSKVEPISKPTRASTSSSNHASTDREPMSANERAKAYAANLKNEMANRRSVDLHMRGVGARRVASDHVAYSGLQSTSTSASTSTASTSTATSTTTVSPASSSSTSPTTLHSPNHDQMFTTFRAPANPHMASSPPESCPSPDNRHSTPPMSQHADDPALSASLSPTFMAQVSLEGKEPYIAQHPHSDEASAEPLEQAPLSPHSPHHHQASFNLTNDAGSAEHAEFVKAGEGDLDIIDAYANEDPDHNMSVPDHESLFGNTDNYLQIEKEISELQQSFKGQVATEEEEKCLFMDEDPQLEQEQLAVKAYAEYEATMAAASCSSSSLPSSHDEE